MDSVVKQTKKAELKKNFTSDLKIELSKIEWPERQYILKSSGIVLLLLVFFSLFVMVTDLGLSKVIFKLKEF